MGVLTRGRTLKAPKGRTTWFLDDKLQPKGQKSFNLSKFDESLDGHVRVIAQNFEILGLRTCPNEGEFGHDYLTCTHEFHYVWHLRTFQKQYITAGDSKATVLRSVPRQAPMMTHHLRYTHAHTLEQGKREQRERKGREKREKRRERNGEREEEREKRGAKAVLRFTPKSPMGSHCFRPMKSGPKQP
jgi:hypothetical protein